MSAGEVKKTEEPLIFHTYPLCKVRIYLLNLCYKIFKITIIL